MGISDNEGMLDDEGMGDSPTADQLEALADEIATFSARVDVAEHALLTRLRLFDRHDGWANTVALSCAEWLCWRVGVGIKAARERVRVSSPPTKAETSPVCC